MRNCFFTLLRLTRNSVLPEFRMTEINPKKWEFRIPEITQKSLTELTELFRYYGNSAINVITVITRKLRKEPEIPVKNPEIP